MESMRIFAYCRVSTLDQTVENQIHEIRAAGYDVQPRHIITETVSGSVKVGDRQEFTKLLHKLDEGDLLVVTKLDRLGRNATDVVDTVNHLASLKVSVKCLALGATDLTSPVGQMTMTILAAVAQFERDLIRERTHAGLARARGEGRVGGRRLVLNGPQQELVLQRLRDGATVRAVAREFSVAPSTIMRVRDGKNKSVRDS